MSNYTNNKLIEKNKNTSWTQVVDLVHDNSLVFDVGCSSGTLGLELKKMKNCIVDGIELDKSDAAIAKTKLRRVEVANVETDDVEKIFGQKYDAVLFIDVIEHLVDPVSSLKKVKGLLKPGGVVIFSIPNMAHISVRLALLRGDFTYTQAGLLDETHIHFYTGKEIERVFSEAGYKFQEFKCSSLTYPKELIDKILKEVGLKASPEFIKEIENTHGNVYQYVGSCQPTNNPTKLSKIPKTNPHEKDHSVFEGLIKSYQKHIQHLDKTIELKEAHIKNIENDLRVKGQELTDIKSSKLFSIATKAKKARRRLKP